MTPQDREYIANILDFFTSSLRQVDLDGFIDDMHREKANYPESRAECWRLERLAIAAVAFREETKSCGSKVTIRE